MKKSELRQIIREEVIRIVEAGPSQQQIKQSQANTKIYEKALKAYNKLLAFLKTWDKSIKNDEPTNKQLSDVEQEMKSALKDIQPFWNSESDASITAGTAAQKLHKQSKSTINGLQYMLKEK